MAPSPTRWRHHGNFHHIQTRARNSAKIRAKWAQHIGTQQALGLTQAAYCQPDGLDSKYFCVWKRKLRPPEPSCRVATAGEAPATLIPVTVTTATPVPREPEPSPVARLLGATLPNGIVLECQVLTVKLLSGLITELARLPC